MQEPAPPRIAEMLVRHLVSRSHREYLVGDLAEGFRLRAAVDVSAARRWYRGQVLRAVRHRGSSPGVRFERFLVDLRYALRVLRANPAFAVVTILSLGLGTGVCTAVFSVADALMLRPLPIHHPEELVQITTDARSNELFTNPLWEALRDREDFLEGAFAVDETTFEVERGTARHRERGAYVSGALFTTLGVEASVGRLINPADDRRGCTPIAVLAHGFWQRGFGGDPGAVGRSIVLDDTRFEIVGIVREGFHGVAAGSFTEIYVPLCADAAVHEGYSMLDAPTTWSLRVIGRRSATMTIEEVAGRLAILSPPVFAATVPPDWVGEQRDSYLDAKLEATPAASGISSVSKRYEASLHALLVFVGVVMLTACANVATLLLARGEARKQELAMRVAVGAGRRRLIGQSVVESLAIATSGSLLGLGLAIWGGPLLVALMSDPDASLRLDLSLDGRVLAFTVALGAATGMLFGMVPAMRAVRVDPLDALKTGGSGSTGSRLRAGRAVVVGQVALSMVLLTGAGLLAATFWRLQTLDPGFERDGVALVAVDLSHTDIPAENRRQVYDDLLARLRQIPGVRAASAAEYTPISGSWATLDVAADGFLPASREDAEMFRNHVAEGYFATLGTPIVAGRDFGPGDLPATEPVALINETLARRVFGGVSAVGRRFQRRLVNDELGPPIRVIGIVKDAKYRGLREPEPPTVYLSLQQRERVYRWRQFVVRLDHPLPQAGVRRGDLRVLPPAVRAAILEIDPEVRAEVDDFAAQVEASLVRERMMAVLSTVFAALTLLLAAIGLYGVVSYSTARRNHEVAVRRALGAQRASVAALVMSDAARLVGSGLLLGGLVGAIGMRLIDPLLYGVAATDPSLQILAAVVLVVTGLLAVVPAARRAMRSEPLVMLRAD